MQRPKQLCFLDIGEFHKSQTELWGIVEASKTFQFRSAIMYKVLVLMTLQDHCLNVKAVSHQQTPVKYNWQLTSKPKEKYDFLLKPEVDKQCFNLCFKEETGVVQLSCLCCKHSDFLTER